MTEYQLIKWGAIAAFAILIVLFYFYSRRLQKKRGIAIKYQADSMGFAFSERGDQAWLSRLQDFSLFTQGYSKSVSNVMTGTYNHLALTIMDYSYVTGGGKNSSTKKQTVLILDSTKTQASFELRPENILDKIGSAFGKNDIDFPTYPHFSRRYLLKGADEMAVRAIFTDSVIQYFEQNPGLCLAFNGGRFLFYRWAKQINPPDIPSFLQQGYDIFRLFKL